MAHSMKSEAMALGARVATMGLGVAVAGHLGGAVIGWLGAGLLSAAGVTVVNEVSKKFGELASEQAAKAAGEAMLAKFDKGQPGLEDAFREALRISLNEVPDEIRSGYEGWFAGWEYALKREVHPDLSSIGTSALLQQSPEDGFCRLLEVLFAQSEALRNDSQSVTGLKSLLDPLRAELLRVLPALLQKNFRDVKNSKDFDRAWKAADDIVQAQLLSLQTRSLEVGLETLEVAKETKEQTALLPQIAEYAAAAQAAAQEATLAVQELAKKIFATNEDKGLVPVERLQEKDAEIARLTELVGKFQRDQQQSTEQVSDELERLVGAGEIDEAIALASKLKAKQMAVHRDETAKLAADCYQLGLLYQMRFDWANALASHKEAWELERDPEYGFQYAYVAQRQKHFDEAISVYEELRPGYVDPADVAMTLNNLALLYSATQRLTEAEGAYGEALEIRRKLAKSNPEAYLPDVAATLNNLALLYSATQRLTEAEGTYGEALEIRRKLAKSNPEAYLPDVAATLNNLAVLYSATQRLTEAEGAYGEALETYHELAKSNPDAYLPDVATTLNNLAVLYSATQRLTEAAGAYGEALEIRRKLAKSNPEVYLPDVATTLNNLAVLCSDTQRLTEAERAYGEALKTCRKLAKSNPEAYLPDVAMTLNNLAILCSDTQRLTEAERAYGEALEIRRNLAESNPDAYLPNMATTLNNIANLYSDTQRLTEAEGAYEEELEILRTLAKSNPDAYLPDVAMTLNNLATLYSDTQRLTEAEGACREAAMILEPLWRRNPTLHGDQMGRIRLMHAWLMEDRGELSEAICAEARRGLEAAYAPTVKAQLSTVMERHCGNGATV